MATVTVTKGQIGVEDIYFDTGGGTTANTWNRTTSIGGTQPIHKVTDRAIPLEDAGSDWAATNLGDMLDGIQAATESFNVLALRGTTDPTIATNNGGIFAKDGATTAEPWPHYRAESDGDMTRILLGGATLKLWIYSNTAQEGWVIDTSVTDVVLSLKGGTVAYNANGGTEAGDFDHTHAGPSHTHTNVTHRHLTSSGLAANNNLHMKTSPPGGTYAQAVQAEYVVTAGTVTPTVNYAYTDNTLPGPVAASGTGQTGGRPTYRPKAAIGTLQFPDVGA